MKKFIAGLVIGLLFTNTFAFAGDSISAVFSNFNFVVNGQAKTVSTQPIVYNGTSYLPVREISNLLGYTVNYKADSRTIELSDASQPAPVDDQTNVTNTSTDTSDLISMRDLHDKYGVDISFCSGEGFNGVRLTYNGKSIEKTEYITIDAKGYFNKGILAELGIN
ncbi:stalk domain-containing protein [Aminipila luticellarii]|uniref:Copper amine oxidase-like N-terminal domain-containing protein n=1 Tax=Aminipila luticellarii TaxID=2507160 RepID=A0A410PWW3_9FIRM|nr:stalk domain-containing protein [Aminipila luticellarii]QAT43433.1 hypothetical protein EQM06_09520 [Aminipila luticellarii]